MRRWISAVAAVAVTASLIVAPSAGAGADTDTGCDTAPIQTALTALAAIPVPGMSVTVDSPRCGMWSGGIGVANLKTGRQVAGDEHSRIGSDTKTWTAVVVLQLVAEGKLSLDGTVGQYLPGLVQTKRYDGRTITIRQLLQHTSGLPDYLAAPYWDKEDGHRWQHIDPMFTVAEALTLKRPKQTATGFAYSNTGYNLLGLIVKQVTGKDIATQIEQRIIEPLHLHQTYWPGDQTTIRTPVLHTYEKHHGQLVDRTKWNVSEADASGELISTGADATTFWMALLSGKLLPPAQLAEMKTSILDDYPPEQYGLGIERYQFTPTFIGWGHSGLMEGGATFSNAVTDNGKRAVTLLINRQLTDAQSDRIQAILGQLLQDLR